MYFPFELFLLPFSLLFASPAAAPRLGLPGGRWTAVLWVVVTAAACAFCGLGFALLTYWHPDLGELFWQAAFIFVCFAVASAQRLLIPKQLSSTSRFFHRTWGWSTVAMGLLFFVRIFFLIGASDERPYEFAAVAAVIAGLFLAAFLGWPQSRELVLEKKKRLLWSIATGIGGAAGAFAAVVLVVWLYSRVIALVGPPHIPAMKPFWILSAIEDTVIWLGVAFGQAVIIFISPPAHDPVESLNV